MRRLIIASTAFVFLLVFFAGVQAGAQRRARRPSPTPATGGAAAATVAPTPDASKPKPKAKLTPLASSDAGQGSRVTITSTDALNNYSAYRSGDRFYVSIPNADAGAVRDSVRGKGFSDTKVQKRGDEVVLSFKLQPGASARVNQRFNRLDVVFTAPGDAGTSTATNTPQPNVSATPRPSNTNTAAATNTPPPTNVTPGTTVAARPTPAATPASSLATNDFPIGGTPATMLPPTVMATPITTASPTAEELAQAQPPASGVPITTAPVSTFTPSAPGTSLSVTLLRNWPLALIALLLLAGVGLFVTTRRSSVAAAPPALLEVPEESLALPVATTKESAKLRPAKTKKKKRSKTLPPTATATKAAPPATAVSTPFIDLPRAEEVAPDSAVEAAQPDAKQPALSEEASLTEDAAAAVASEQVIAPSDAVTDGLVASQAVAPPVAVDADSVQAETKLLLEGESYNKSMVGSADMVARQMVAAELLSALAGRNPERRTRARAAFIEHGYFNDTTKDLRLAEAPAERASAARSLGLVGDHSATAHLIDALDDPAMEVRRTTVEALALLKDPAAIAPLEALQEREKNAKVRVPPRIIKHAIDACTVIEDDETPTLVAATPPVEVATARPVEDVAVETPQPAVEPAPPVEAPTVEASAVEVEQPIDETPTLETQRVEATTLDEASPEAVATEATAAEKVAIEETAVVEATREEVTAQATTVEESPSETSLIAESAESVSSVAVETPTVETIDEPEAFAPSVEEPAATEEVLAGTSTPTIEEAAPLASMDETRESAAVVEETTAATTTIEEVVAPVDEIAATPDEDVATVGGDDSTVATVAEVVETESLTVAPAFDEAPFLVEEAQPAPAAAASEAPEFETATAETDQLSGAETDFPRFVSRERAVHDGSYPRIRAVRVDRRVGGNTGSRKRHGDRAPPPSPAATATTDTGHDEATAGDWVEFDMGTAESDQSSTPDDSLAFGFTDFDASSAATDEATAIDAFEFEKSIDRAPDADAFASSVTGSVPVTDDAVAAGDLSLDASAVDAPSGEEKSIAPAGEGEDYSTVPKAIQLRLASDEPEERAIGLKELSRVSAEDAFREICAGFDDPSEEVRAAAARSLYDMRDDRAETFTHALRDAPPDRRRKIGAAIASSGLAGEAISHLTGESRDKTYEAFSLLFLMAKAGEVQPLIRAIEGHQNNDVRLAVVKLLALSGQADILPAFRRLAVRGSLPPEIRTAVMEAIYQISSTQQPA